MDCRTKLLSSVTIVSLLFATVSIHRYWSECNVAYIAHQRSQSVIHLKPSKPLIYYCIEKNNTTNQNEDSLPSSTSKSDTIQSSAVAGRWVSTDNVPFSESFKNNLVPLAESLFHTFISQTQVSCPHQIRPGRPGDGGYEICMLNGVHITTSSCLVYSFGISLDWSFDDELAEKYQCEVHSFDPSIKQIDHMRKPNLHFHNMGIWDKDMTNDDGWKLRKLSTIISELKHENVIIDVLKMDTEGAEWPCLVEWLTSGVLSRVKQIAIEVHTPKLRDRAEVMTLEDHLRLVWIFEELDRQGFRKFLADTSNNCCGVFSDWTSNNDKNVFCCYELFYINTHYLD